MRLIKTKKNFRREFKRQLRYAIAAACGFMIIYAWRDAILQSAKNIVQKFANSTLAITSEIATSVLITVIGVIIILISSRILKD